MDVDYCAYDLEYVFSIVANPPVLRIWLCDWDQSPVAAQYNCVNSFCSDIMYFEGVTTTNAHETLLSM